MLFVFRTFLGKDTGIVYCYFMLGLRPPGWVKNRWSPVRSIASTHSALFRVVRVIHESTKEVSQSLVDRTPTPRHWSYIRHSTIPQNQLMLSHFWRGIVEARFIHFYPGWGDEFQSETPTGSKHSGRGWWSLLAHGGEWVQSAWPQIRGNFEWVHRTKSMCPRLGQFKCMLYNPEMVSYCGVWASRPPLLVGDAFATIDIESVTLLLLLLRKKKGFEKIHFPCVCPVQQAVELVGLRRVCWQKGTHTGV